jgi:uncharacterized protein YegP (UPF0339 family)
MAEQSDCVHCQNAARRGTGKLTRSGGCEWHLIKRKDGKYGWHLIGDNGSDIIATDGGQGYSNAKDAADMMKKIRSGHYSQCPMEPR